MQTEPQAHARISIPADCLFLVSALVTRLGGIMTDSSADANPGTDLAASERGGKMLRALRLRAGMTQKTLADAIGLPQSHISEFEKNRRAVPYKHAQKLAELLHSIPGHFIKQAPATITAINGAGKGGSLKHNAPKIIYKNLKI